MARVGEVVQQVRLELGSGQHGDARDRFLTVRQIASRYGISLVTAQRAVQQLKKEGLLIGDSTNASIISPKAIAPRTITASAALHSDQGQPRRFGMVVANITNPFFSRLCRYVQHTAADCGYQVLMADSFHDFQREEKAVESFLQIGVDGLLVAPGLDEACKNLYRHLIDRKVPLVLIGRRMEGVAADFVMADNARGGWMVASHLLKMGYDSFGYIRFDARLKRDERLSGFRTALWEEGVSLDSKQIVNAEGGTVEHGRRAMARLMRSKTRPRAVFAYHDLLAIGAILYCQEHGISVPEEVAIVGFDNLPESRVTTPALTTVRYPIESMAQLAVKCLIDNRTRGLPSQSNHHISLEPRLVIRRSSDLTASPQDSAAMLASDIHDVL